MSRRVPFFVLAVAVLAAAVAVSLFAATRTPVVESPRASTETLGVGGSAAGSGASPASAPRPAAKARTGRVLPVDQAIKELNLIRPSKSKAAQDFTLPMLDGKKLRLQDQRGKVVFVNFWATWCPPCREEMPAMERLYRQHKDQGLVMMAVSLDAESTVVPPFVKEHGFTFPVVLDPSMEVANSYGIRALPSSFVVDPQGQVVGIALGPRAWDGDAAHSLVEGMLH